MSVRPDWTARLAVDLAAARPGLTLCAFCLLPLLLPATAANWLEYRREAVLSGEVWRLWSAHLVHYSVGHAVHDGLACLLLATGLQRAGAGRGMALRLVAIAPILSLLILLSVPEMTNYRGASGLAMALLAALNLTLWWIRPGWRPGLLALAAVLALKLVADMQGFAVFPGNLPPDIAIAWQVHLAGLVCGWLFWRRAGGG